MDAIRNWYKNLSNSSRAGLAGTFFTFLGTIVFQVLGLLAQAQDWVNNGGAQPNLNAQGKLFVSAALALATGLINWGWRYVQEKRNPLSVPQYPKAVVDVETPLP